MIVINGETSKALTQADDTSLRYVTAKAATS